MYIYIYVYRESVCSEGKIDDVERPVVSETPGTTLGIIPLRAFRRSRTLTDRASSSFRSCVSTCFSVVAEARTLRRI